MNVIDLFAGAGGLSEGFRLAGFNIISHVEMDRSACNTLRTREAYYFLKQTNSLQSYLDYLEKRITRQELYEIIPDNVMLRVIEAEINHENLPVIKNLINTNLKRINSSNIDLIIGGPPCQSYSRVGIARDPDRMENDPRNYLYRYYIEFLRQYKPKMFLFENVKGILSAQKGKIFSSLKSKLDQVGYTIDYKVLNSKDFGVSQNRKRVFLIGWKQKYQVSYPDFEATELPCTIAELFTDLPPLVAGQSIDGEKKYLPNKIVPNSFIRNTKWNLLTQHIARNHNNNDLSIYRHVVNTWNKEGRLIKYNELPEKWQTHKNRSTFLDRYKIVPFESISHTVVAHISKDGHYYIHPDIEQNRSISVREAARIQSFPDNFYFEDSRTAAFRQIGNAVPPLMAYKIAQQIKKTLRTLN